LASMIASISEIETFSGSGVPSGSGGEIRIISHRAGDM
jgi:hypothetical protein